MLVDTSSAQDCHLTFSSIHEDLIFVLPRSLESIVLMLLSFTFSSYLISLGNWFFMGERPLPSWIYNFHIRGAWSFQCLYLYIQSMSIFYEMQLYPINLVLLKRRALCSLGIYLLLLISSGSQHCCTKQAPMYFLTSALSLHLGTFKPSPYQSPRKQVLACDSSFCCFFAA